MQVGDTSERSGERTQAGSLQERWATPTFSARALQEGSALSRRASFLRAELMTNNKGPAPHRQDQSGLAALIPKAITMGDESAGGYRAAHLPAAPPGWAEGTEAGEWRRTQTLWFPLSSTFFLSFSSFLCFFLPVVFSTKGTIQTKPEQAKQKTGQARPANTLQCVRTPVQGRGSLLRGPGEEVY